MRPIDVLAFGDLPVLSAGAAAAERGSLGIEVAVLKCDAAAGIAAVGFDWTN